MAADASPIEHNLKTCQNRKRSMDLKLRGPLATRVVYTANSPIPFMSALSSW
jgi:hypothetical protein